MVEVTIKALGSHGDGIGEIDGKTVYLPYTLAGETVIAQTGDNERMVLDQIVEPSPHRVDPPCPHFGICGGCSLQHMAADKLLDWKRDQVMQAFAREKIEARIDPCIAAPRRSRRRVTLTARRGFDAVLLGFNVRASHDLVDISACTILQPELESALPGFRQLAATLLRGGEDITLTATSCDNGIDLDFGVEQEPTEAMTAALVRALARTDVLRASINHSVIMEKEKPLITFDTATITLPPGGFLQAVPQAENTMATLVVDHLANCRRITDLFSGSGTFSLRIARHARVHAVEMEHKALHALMAATGTDGLRAITSESRDLYERPLMASELKKFDGLCLDPPRAGARAQIEEIVKAKTGKIAYISCNPKTLARDTAVLLDGGYTIDRVIPIDQFQFSHHVEVVALLSRKPVKKTRSIFRG